jgi:xanthine dehydrogenase accessory factor
MNLIYKAIIELEEQGKSAVLCTIVESKGSTPRHQSSKMLVYPDGRIIGTVGGGEIENRVIQEALKAYTAGETKLLFYKLNDPTAGDPGICGGQVSIFVEPIGKKDMLLIIGAGHVGKAVAHLAKWLGFRVIVSDDRAALCTPDLIPDADLFLVTPMKNLPKLIELRPSSYLVLSTRGSDVDVAGLPEILKTSPSYIGVIGSKRRWILTQKGLKEAGVPEDTLNKIRSPIGLELQAETPEEIAVSIMAEIIMIRNKGTGIEMRM